MVAVGAVAEDARAVLEEGGDRDAGELGSGVRQLGHVLAERVVETEGTQIGELQDRGGREGLGVRGHAEQVAGVSGASVVGSATPHASDSTTSPCRAMATWAPGTRVCQTRWSSQVRT